MTEERERERDADSQTKEEKACMWEENDFVGMLYMRVDLALRFPKNSEAAPLGFKSSPSIKCFIRQRKKSVE